MLKVAAPPSTRALLVVCALVGLAAVAWLHHEVLFGGMVYHMDDAADGYYPSHVEILRAYREGTLPTWSNGSWCGWPLAADPYYGAFYPLTIVFALFGAVRGLGWQVALHVLLAGVGMFALLRRRKLDVGPSLLGAASLALGSFMAVRIRHIIFIQGMAWLPLCLYGIDAWLESRRWPMVALAGLAGGMALLCGALPLALFFALVVAAYALPRALAAERRGQALVGLALAALVAALLGAAQMAPTLAHIPSSPRALGVDYAFASSYAWPKLAYLGTLVAPELFGTEERASWFGAFNHWEMAGYYAGACVVLLMPLGLARARRKIELAALFVLSLVAIALAFGDAGPLHGFFFRHVPLYKSLRCPTRALVMFLLAAPILAAEGLDWLTTRDRAMPASGSGVPPASRRAAIVAVVIALVIVAGGLVARHFVLHPHKLIPNELTARHAFAHLLVVVGAGGALVALLVAGVRRREAALALALVTVVDLLVIARGSLQPKPGDYAAGMERFAAVDWLLAQHPTDRFAPEANGPFRLHNVGMVYGIDGASGYDSVSVWHYVNFLYAMNHGAPYPFATLKDDLAAGDVRNFASPLVDLLNVRWAIATAPPAPGWIERFHPSGAPHAKYEPMWDARLRVYENPHVLPRAFVVYRADVLDDGAQARALPTLNPRTRVLLDRAPTPAPVGDDRPFTPAKLVRHERQRVTIDAEATAPGILVVSDTDYPGWRVTVDGKPAQLLRADYAFRGVALAAGHHTVEMTFDSRATRLGLLLTALGFIALGLLVGVGFRGRRQPTMV